MSTTREGLTSPASAPGDEDRPRIALEPIYQRARRLGAAAGTAGLILVAIRFDQPLAALVAAATALITVHAWRRVGAGEGDALISLLLDATVTALALWLIRPPGLVAVPPLSYLVVAAPLLLPSRRAAWVVGYAMTATATALFLALGSTPDWDRGAVILFVAVAALSVVPALFRLLQEAGRAMAERESLRDHLAERERRYRGLVEGVPVGIYRTTPDGSIVAANPALAEILGYHDPAELMREKVVERYAEPELRQEWSQTLEAEGTVHAWEIPLRRRDGAPIWVRDTARVVRSPEGETLFYEGMIEDVTERKQAEEALREGEERYRTLVEASPLAIAVHCEGRLVYVNRATALLLGASTPEELIGRPVLDFVHPDHHPMARERIGEVIEKRNQLPLAEETFVRLDGSTIEVEAAGIPILHRGRPASQVVIRDVTAQKRAEREARERSEELDRLFSLTAEVNAGRSVSDILDVIFESFRELIPYHRMEYADLEEDGTILHTRWVRADYQSRLIAPGHRYRKSGPTTRGAREARAMIDNDLVAYASSRPEDNPTRLLVAEGLRSALSYPLLLDGRVVGYLFFSSRAPGTYRPGHVTLVDRVAGQIAAAIQQSRLRDELMARNLELEGLNRSRTQFLANVSHELRTPLTAVVGLAAEMRDRLGELSRDEVVDFAELIAVSSTEVAGIVEDLLLIARAEAGQLSVVPERIDLGEMIRLAIETWCPAEVDRIAIVGDRAEAWADAGRVRQIVRNLCSNARRYGGERVEVRVRNEGHSGVVVVADDGPGIPESQRELIFEAYIRAGTDRTRSSVGLGLTVSRQLARAMGGDLGYEYAEGESRFELRLPVAPARGRMETVPG